MSQSSPLKSTHTHKIKKTEQNIRENFLFVCGHDTAKKKKKLTDNKHSIACAVQPIVREVLIEKPWQHKMGQPQRRRPFYVLFP